jgi:hypothetical protein
MVCCPFFFWESLLNAAVVSCLIIEEKNDSSKIHVIMTNCQTMYVFLREARSKAQENFGLLH